MNNSPRRKPGVVSGVPVSTSGGEHAILVVSTIGNRQVIAGRCARSAAAGVRLGMTLAHARALLRDDGRVCVEPFTPERDAAALHWLARWSIRFTPKAAVDAPNGLMLDITGCQRLFRGERRLVRSVADGVRRLGFAARLASAPSIGCAWAMARFGRDDICIVGDDDSDIRSAIALLPVAALRIDEDAQDALAMIGIERIEHLFNVPRAELPSRFGFDLLLRLDQVLGRSIETIDPIRPEAPVLVERAFDGPTRNAEGIEITVRQLIDQLHDKLQQRESGALKLDLKLVRIDAAPIHIDVTLSRPSRDPKHLWSLLRAQVEKANLGFGVEQITLTATRLGSLSHEQISQWPELESPDDDKLRQCSGELLDRLTNRLGADRVTEFDIVETHIPERVFVSRPVLEPSPSKRRQTKVTDSDRPSMLFARPEPAEVIAVAPEGPPSWLKWRGRSQRIVSSMGPERIARRWWGGGGGATVQQTYAEPQAPLSGRPAGPPVRGSDVGVDARDYFRVQDERGAWLWVYREVDGGRWFVHGQWA